MPKSVELVFVAAGAGVPLDWDMARGIGLRGLPQAIFSFSQKVVSPSAVTAQENPSPWWSWDLSLPGELWLGSGDVPHDELAPYCDTDEAEGESLVDELEWLLNWNTR